MTAKRIAVTGARGLIGWHTAGRLHAANCMARFRGQEEPYDLVPINQEMFADDEALRSALDGCCAILHFAGVNRGGDIVVENANPQIAHAIQRACSAAAVTPHIVYANSMHYELDTPYGRSKRIAGEILADIGGGFTNLVLPHIFGETARAFYNNVTGTLIDQLWTDTKPTISSDGQVQLLHAGEAAVIAINAAEEGSTTKIAPAGLIMSVQELYDKLTDFHHLYTANVMPELDNSFDLALFNSYRTGGFPLHYPKQLKSNRDTRGVLFETSRAQGGSQTFVSTTVPGGLRGDHFHIDLVERFIVVSGKATIRVRKILTNEIHSFEVSGDDPVAIDMPPMHTHHIENSSNQDVVTMFWAHRMFDPSNPDTFADSVFKENCQK